VHDRVGIFEWDETTGSARRIRRFENENVFGLWSPNNENFCAILNNGENAANKGMQLQLGRPFTKRYT